MNSATWTAIQKANLSASGYKWTGRDASGRNTSFDYPVYDSPSMANLGATNKIAGFGNLRRFVRRQVRGSLTVKQYNERYAPSGQIAWEGFLRVDGKLAKATNSPPPVRFLQWHS